MPATILICDDELPIRAVLGMKFKAAGFNVRECDNGVDGLALALESTPDLIITDYQMPGGDGLTLAEALAAIPSSKAIPVVMLTGRGHIVDEARLSRTGIVKLIDKPFSARAVVEAVTTLLVSAQKEAA